jgi:hypothetical protein
MRSAERATPYEDVPPGDYGGVPEDVQICETRDEYVEVPGTAKQLTSSPYLCKAREKGRRVMSLWTNNPADPSTPTMVDMQLLANPQTPDDKPRCWQIAVWGREVQQRPPVLPAEGFEPVDISEISTDGPHITKLKARIRFYNAEGGTEREFDIAEGVRTCVVACSVYLDILVPEDHILPDKFIDENAGQQWPVGLILNSIVGGWIGEVVGARPEKQVLTNTQTILVDAGDANVRAQIPPGARRLSMYQTRPGAVLDPYWSMEDINNPTSIGAIILGADRSVEHLDRPGSARTVALGVADQQNDRVVTLVWELEG